LIELSGDIDQIVKMLFRNEKKLKPKLESDFSKSDKKNECSHSGLEKTVRMKWLDE